MPKIASTLLVLTGLIAWNIPAAWAAGGPLGIDHRLNYDNSGIWKRSYQLDLETGAIAAVVAGSLWEGGDTRLGRTFWQSLDSLALSSITAQGLKLAFSRERPAQTDDPNAFFKGHGNESFPSGEVTVIASAVTPFVLEYGPEHPAVYGLEALVAYDMVARLKVQGHWQSDVLAGAAIGTAFGYYAHGREQPLILGYMPHGIFIGLKEQF
ncbi:MAG: phosphatase PAP2 family protein [Stenotrophobium sp.]